MSRDDWYRNTTWTEQDRAEFFSRLNRSRSAYHKCQYARIQAAVLAHNGLHAEALGLLETVINEYPELSQLAEAYLQEAESHAALGDHKSAIVSFRRALDVEQEYPNVRTQAWLKFAWYVVEINREDLFAEATDIIRKHEEQRELQFPIEVYRWAGVKAILAKASGLDDLARHFAAKALRAAEQVSSGFRYHPDLGLVSDTESKVHNQLKLLIQR